MILLFNINIFKLNSIRVLCQDLGIDIYTAGAGDLKRTIGQLAGLADTSSSSMHKGAPVSFTEEMMVFCGITPDQLDAFLDNYQKRGIHPISLKAVLTPVNALWTPLRLSRELMKERDAFSGTSS